MLGCWKRLNSGTMMMLIMMMMLCIAVLLVVIAIPVSSRCALAAAVLQNIALCSFLMFGGNFLFLISPFTCLLFPLCCNAIRFLNLLIV